jgi:hypothetical protein
VTSPAPLVAEPAAAPPSSGSVARAPRKPARQRVRNACGSELGAVAGGRMLPLQAKLEVGSVDDPLEHEAERVARQVMRMPSSGGSPPRCACGGTPGPGGECAACRGKRLARVAVSPAAPAQHEAPPSVHATLAQPGRALDTSTRAFFEPRLGRDLGGVRVHDDPRAHTSARDVSARAYTVGSDIVFGSGLYRPGSEPGRALLAHELAHVMQQARGPPRVQRQPAGGDVDPVPAGPAGGCGLCYADQFPGAVGPREAGTAAHRWIQAAMQLRYPDLIPREQIVHGRVEDGKLDLARVVPPDILEIGEIKPSDSIDVGIFDLDFYLKLLAQDPAWKKYKIRPLELPCPQPLPFPTLSPNCPEQRLYVANAKGLYLYFCQPSFAELLRRGCNCGKRRRKGEEDQPHGPPIFVDPRLEGDIRKGTGEETGKGNGRPTKGNGEPSKGNGEPGKGDKRPGRPRKPWGPEISDTARNIILGLAALAAIIMLIFPPARIAGFLGTLLGALLKWLGFGLALAGGAAVAGAASSKEGGADGPGAGRTRTTGPPSGPPAGPPVVVPRATGPPTGTTGPPAGTAPPTGTTGPPTGTTGPPTGTTPPTGTAPPTRPAPPPAGKTLPSPGTARPPAAPAPPPARKTAPRPPTKAPPAPKKRPPAPRTPPAKAAAPRQRIGMKVIEGLRLDRVIPGAIYSVTRDPGGRHESYMLLKAMTKSTHGDDTTVEFESVLECDKGAKCTQGGNVYTVTHPYRASAKDIEVQVREVDPKRSVSQTQAQALEELLDDVRKGR